MKVQLFIALFSSIGFSADMSFEQQALQTISAHYGKELTDLPALTSDPEKYIRVSIGIYKSIEADPNEAMIGEIATSHSEMVERMGAEMLGAKFGGLSISIGGVKMSANNGIVTINGKSQKSSAKNMADVNEALQKGYNIAIRNCLSNIASAAERVLI